MNENQTLLAKNLLRVIPEQMNNSEFNLGLALLMGYDILVENTKVKAFINNEWIDYEPMTNSEQFLTVVSHQPVSSCTHSRYNTDNEPDGFWYSAHAFYSQTETNGLDYKNVIAQSCIKLLNHNILYPSDD